MNLPDGLPAGGAVLHTYSHTYGKEGDALKATTYTPTPPSVERLITEALAIQAEEAQEAGALGFMARAMTLATLPHRKVDGNEFTRRNGAFTLSIMAPGKIGLPYGSIPRLLLAWVTTEAVRTRERELVLGDSMAAFMAELGLSRQGSNIASLKNQSRRLFASTVTATYEASDRIADIGYRLADSATLWWEAGDPRQRGLWASTVVLSEKFYREVVERPIPVDMRALKALKRSPLALDIYCTLTYRASYAKKPTEIPWPALAAQFGSDYKVLRQFKAAFLAELRRVQQVYPEIQVAEGTRGLILTPSPTHVRKAVRALPDAG